jgi:hypothetical protein
LSRLTNAHKSAVNRLVALDDNLIAVEPPDRHCSPRHRLPLDSGNEGSKCVG